MKAATSPILSLLILPWILIPTSEIALAQFSPFPSQIKHVVVIFQENRTPDNLFHFLSPLCPIPAGASGLQACTPHPVTTACYNISPCGLSNQSGSVVPVTLTGLPLAGSSDANHTHAAFAQMCDADPANGYACRNDGIWKVNHTDKAANQNSYAYVLNPAVTNSDGSAGHVLDPYLAFAEQYGWANFMYQTNQGPSYPAHQFMFSGTSARSTSEDALSIFVADNYLSTPDVGCLAAPKATVGMVSPVLGAIPKGCVAYDGKSVQECTATNTDLVYPTNPVGSFCFNKPTMGSVLDEENLTWKYYSASPGSIWTAPNSIQSICVPQFTSPTTLKCTGTEWNANVDVNNRGTDILRDIAKCDLSSVSWVTPDGTWSDHAGVTNIYGPSWVAAIINAIGQNPQCGVGTTNVGETFWNNTAIVVTWDDWGGWTDHEPPPLASPLPCTYKTCQGDYQYGFRVPLIVVSAYTPKGYISNQTYDFGSVLRMIEGIYQIPQGTLGVADERASTDLSDFFTAAFRAYKPVPALVNSNYFLGKEVKSGTPAPADDDDDDE